jgi:hypothetical protein
VRERAPSPPLGTRLTRAWRALAPDRRLAAICAVALVVTMLLPWYQENVRSGSGVIGHDVSAFGVFTFVEAAVLLVALFVLGLLFARAEGRAFHLPGGDGAVVMGAGLWAVLLLVWRLFDKPGVSAGGINVGVQWGIFFALCAAGLLAYAGSRMRALDRPEPPLVERRRPPAPRGAAAEPAPAAAPGTTRTRVLAPETPAVAPSAQPRSRPRRAPAPEDQLTIPLGGEPDAPAGGEPEH